MTWTKLFPRPIVHSSSLTVMGPVRCLNTRVKCFQIWTITSSDQLHLFPCVVLWAVDFLVAFIRYFKQILLKFCRLFSLIMSRFPPALVNRFAENELNKRFDHEHYRLKPRHGVFSQVSVKRFFCRCLEGSSLWRLILVSSWPFASDRFCRNTVVVFWSFAFVQ